MPLLLPRFGVGVDGAFCPACLPAIRIPNHRFPFHRSARETGVPPGLYPPTATHEVAAGNDAAARVEYGNCGRFAAARERGAADMSDPHAIAT